MNEQDRIAFAFARKCGKNAFSQRITDDVSSFTYDDLEKAIEAVEKLGPPPPRNPLVMSRATARQFDAVRDPRAPHRLFGFDVIQTPMLTKTERVRRSWRERLFSLPWRPWVAWKTIEVPDDRMYLVDLDADEFVLPTTRRSVV